MIGVLSSVFVASLLGSVHCAGTCGGLAALASARGTSLWGTAAYQLGRLAAYTVLGAGAGTLGAGVDLAGDLVGVARGAAFLAGLLMIAWAIGEVVPWLQRRRAKQQLLRPRRRSVEQLFTRVYQRAAGLRPGWRGALLGVASGALPCGFLYAFVLMAAGSGSAFAGMLLMSTFWLGGVPMLLGIGALTRRLSSLVRPQLPMVFAAALLSLGLATIWTRHGMALSTSAPTAATSIPTPPCHQ